MNYAAEFHEYRENAIRILTETGFFKGVMYEEEGNCRQLTIYGFWMIEKITDPSGTIVHKALRRRSDDFRQWEDIPPKSDNPAAPGAPRLDWPMSSLPLYNYKRNSGYLFSGIVETALNLANIAAGFSRYFPDIPIEELHSASEIRARRLSAVDSQLKKLKKYTEKRNVREIRKIRKLRGEIPYYERGVLGELPWPVVYRDAVAGRAYRLLMKRSSIHLKMFYATFWNHMADRELYRAVLLAVHSRIATLDDYMRFARARDAVVRLFHEKPSMLPALNFLPMNEWGKQDILSAKRWIRSLRTYRKTSVSFASPGAYRLFQRLPPSAASRICDELGSAAAYGDQKNYIPRFMENLVQAQIGPKIPAQLIDLFMDFIGRGEFWGEFSSFILRLVGREYLRLKGKRSRPDNDEFSRLRRELNLVCDWQRFTFDVPPSNASWRGLVRRAEAWHGQLESADAGNWQAKLEAAPDVPGWEDPFAGREFTVMEHITVHPLVSPAALIREGIEMEHCLKWDMWREECLAGSLLCYSLTLDTTRERSTLAVRKYSDRIEIAQHYGLANCLPCTELSEGARQVLHMIQQHLKGCIE